MQTGDHADNTTSPFSTQGERKYLNERERKRFYNALPVLMEASERTFCEAIFWTGCRPREALELEILRVDVEDGVLIFRSLKKRGKNKGKQYRIVPIPKSFAKRLDKVHGILKTQKQKGANLSKRLWTFSRQTGWLRIKAVMEKAGIFGIRACARGLRHSFGVQRILSGIPAATVQLWMGHSSLKYTAIYTKTMGAEDRSLARLSWKREAYAAYG